MTMLYKGKFPVLMGKPPVGRYNFKVEIYKLISISWRQKGSTGKNHGRSKFGLAVLLIPDL